MIETMTGEAITGKDATNNTTFTPSVFLDGKVELFGGDSREILRGFPDNHFSSIVCDPPYALVSIVKRFGGENAAPPKDYGDGNGLAAYARAARGFMGKQWDTGETAFAVEFWAEIMRVLKPGGHVVAFSGTRSYHRLACAIEDSGFEIRDMLSWHYGCLDDKSMAVTNRGLLSYGQINVGDMALSYDVTTKSYEWQEIEEVLTYEVNDTVYRISTDYGDQVVSRNHRCIIEQDGAEFFLPAEEAARKQKICVPVLENLPELLAAISNAHERAGEQKQDVLLEMCELNDWSEGSAESQADRPTCGKIYRNVHGMQEGVFEKHKAHKTSEAADVLIGVQWDNARRRMEDIRSYGARELEAGVGNCISGAHDWRHEPVVEGRGNAPTPERELCERQVREVSTRLNSDVAQGWIYNASSIGGCEGVWPTANEGGMCSPYRSQSAEQRVNKFDDICNEQGPQVVRARCGHKSTMGRIAPEQYSGVIWCIRVKSGAFVAVRDGFAFPTGNSGFPKSHDISKAIDRAAGAERSKVKIKHSSQSLMTKDGQNERPWQNVAKELGYHEAVSDEAVSDEAKKWQGYGTALKPATEPIVLARKPLSEKTVAANVLKWGTGALNIDGCRVGSETMAVTTSNGQLVSGNGSMTGGNPGIVAAGHKEGRWPANIVHDGSDEVLAGFPDSGGGNWSGKQNGAAIWGNGNDGYQGEKKNSDSGSAARFFYTAKADKLDRIGSKHPTVKPVDLMQWLCRLVTPPGGRILDPFAGSGSTGEAAWREGFSCVLIERDPEYQADIAERLRLANAGPMARKARAIRQVANDNLPLFGGAVNDNLFSEAA